MPGPLQEALTDKRKRKRADDSLSTSRKKAITQNLEPEHSNDEIEGEIWLFEQEISGSRKHYNKIQALIGYASGQEYPSTVRRQAWISLCRIFAIFLSTGEVVRIPGNGSDRNDWTVKSWLLDRYQDFLSVLLRSIATSDQEEKSLGLRLLMQLFKEEYLNDSSLIDEDSQWMRGTFLKILNALIETKGAEQQRLDFVRIYVLPYPDVRFYTFRILWYIATSYHDKYLWLTSNSKHIPTTDPTISVDSRISILAAIGRKPNVEEQAQESYTAPCVKKKHAFLSMKNHMREAEKAWLVIIQGSLSKAQRKLILELMSHSIVPWFLRLEFLMDFLTDSFNVGGSTSLLALSGLFHLIQEKNLDYPHFYQKLYSHLDCHILHSKHRSRFFRLLCNFLGSTHLPVVLVASFIKRFGRLCLHSPTPGIVAIVPWIYNLLKGHPTCSFMIHRLPQAESIEFNDPFQATEKDPMKTRAIESSLWEIETLQAHYHPNIAAIGRIISEQFTKHAYHIEDFLDHSYGSVSCSHRIHKGDLTNPMSRYSMQNYQNVLETHLWFNMIYPRRYCLIHMVNL